jgi:putative MATE family efflux protein
MAHGSIVKRMLLFAWPVLLGLILQQFYNTVDALVVGNYVGHNALAAVGSISGTLVNVVISFAFGLFTGANVLISQFYGAEDKHNLHDMVHTELVLSAVLGIFLAVAGYIFTPVLLGLIKTPAEVLPNAVTYLRIYFIGLPALFIYNAGASILNSMGDSKSPLVYLIVSTLLNVVGDLVFVLVFKWGVGGVAASTVLAEVVSTVLVIQTLRKADGAHRIFLKDLKINWGLLKKATAIGVPGGIQGTIVSLSNFAVQSYINGLGPMIPSGYSAAEKIDAFANMPIQTMAMVLATFVGQNLGAHQVARARKGVKIGMMLCVGITAIMSITVVLASRPLLGLFSSEPEVMEIGTRFMRCLVPFYFILSATMGLPGALRGAGDVRMGTFASVFSFVVVRQIYLFIISRSPYYSIETVAAGYPGTWVLCGIIMVIYYLRTDWSRFEEKKEANQPALT